MADLSSWCPDACPVCPPGADIAQDHVEPLVCGCKRGLSFYSFILSPLFKWEFLMLKFQTEGLRR